MSTEIRYSRQDGWSDEAWDQFVGGHAAAHPLQLTAWGALKSDFGWDAAQLGLEQEGRLVAGTQILFRKLPRLGALPLRIAYVPKGPLLDWADAGITRALFHALHRFCLRSGALMLKIEPEQPHSPDLSALLRALNFRPSSRTIQPRTTLWLDLRPDEDIILANMKQKWRYNVRLAERKGVTVRQGDAADLALFNNLMQATGERNEFGVHSAAYYQRFWELFGPSGQAALFIAEREGRALAALMALRLAGRAYYLYGASANEERQLMPSHLLQWQTMRWAKAHGCTAYDFWGIPDEVGLDPDAPIPDPATDLWGVWRFKRGFGGEIMRYTGAWDRYFVPLLPLLMR